MSISSYNQINVKCTKEVAKKTRSCTFSWFCSSFRALSAQFHTFADYNCVRELFKTGLRQPMLELHEKKNNRHWAQQKKCSILTVRLYKYEFHQGMFINAKFGSCMQEISLLNSCSVCLFYLIYFPYSDGILVFVQSIWDAWSFSISHLILVSACKRQRQRERKKMWQKKQSGMNAICYKLTHSLTHTSPSL